VKSTVTCYQWSKSSSKLVNWTSPVRSRPGRCWCRIPTFKQIISVNLKGILTSDSATPRRARSNDLAGRSTALAPPWFRPAYCFASVIVWTDNKNVTILDRFICFIFWQWNNQRRWWSVFWGWWQIKGKSWLRLCPFGAQLLWPPM